MEREKWNVTRSNLRKTAVKRVNQLFETLHDEDSSVMDYTSEKTNEERSVEHEVIASSFVMPRNSRSDSDRESKSTSD